MANPQTNSNHSQKINTGAKSDSAQTSMIPGVSQDRIDGIKQNFSDVMENVNGRVEGVSSFIKARPMLTFAAAIGVGFLVGTLILRSKGRLSAEVESEK